MITIFRIDFTATCRKCAREEDFRRRVTGDNVEVESHEHLEAEGWVDSLCPTCVKTEFKAE